MVETKSCRPGGHNPPATDEFFYRNKKTGRLRGHCKECRCKSALQWHEDHADQHRARMRAYAADHAVEARERRQRHYENNKDDYIVRSRERELQIKLARVEHVDRQVVFERDEGICGICREPVERNDFHIDHVIPLSKGGEHSYANVQVAHPPCNLAKSDRLDFAPIMQEGRGSFAV